MNTKPEKSLAGIFRLIPSAAICAGSGILVWWVFGCSKTPEIPPIDPQQDSSAAVQPMGKPPRPSEKYAGSKACVLCHKKICDSYHSHPMARSAAAVSELSLLEGYSGNTTFTTPGSYLYRVERDSDGVFHHESKSDGSGKLIYDQRVKVDIVIGSGKRGRTYLINRRGLLFESPITWYSGRKRWDLSPGYVAGQHPRFERRITDACLNCHAGRVNPDPEQAYRFKSPVILETMVGCERCHGPGQDHIAFQNGLKRKPGDSDPIVNPAKLPPRKREAVCYQCHLHGEERVLRYGRSEFDFRPGMELDDVWLVVVHGDRLGPDGSTRAVSHVEQMRQSVCFQKSNGQLGCISCHDAHSAPTEETRIAHYRAKCSQCHTGPEKTQCSKPLAERKSHTARNSCIDCHMPRLKASDVPHTSQTDHRALRDPNHNAVFGAVPARLTFFDKAADRVPSIAVDRARALFAMHDATLGRRRTHAEDALKLLLPVLKAAPDDVKSLHAAGRACQNLGLFDDARQHWNRALELQPKYEPVLADFYAMEHRTGNLPAGLKLVDRLIAINPWRSDFYGSKAHMLGQMRQYERGIESAKKALELNPTMPNVHGWLAETYRILGKEKESRYHDKLRQEFTRNQ